MLSPNIRPPFLQNDRGHPGEPTSSSILQPEVSANRVVSSDLRSNGSHAQVLALKKMGREGAPWAPSSFLQPTDGGAPSRRFPFPIHCSCKGADPGQRRAFRQLS